MHILLCDVPNPHDNLVDTHWPGFDLKRISFQNSKAALSEQRRTRQGSHKVGFSR